MTMRLRVEIFFLFIIVGVCRVCVFLMCYVPQRQDSSHLRAPRRPRLFFLHKTFEPKTRSIELKTRSRVRHRCVRSLPELFIERTTHRHTLTRVRLMLKESIGGTFLGCRGCTVGKCFAPTGSANEGCCTRAEGQ